MPFSVGVGCDRIASQIVAAVEDHGPPPIGCVKVCDLELVGEADCCTAR